MKKLLPVLLAAALLLTGCSAMLQRPYSSSVEHVEYTVTEDSSILRAETYRGLVDALLYFVNEHADQGVIRLYNYTTDVEADLDTACLEVTQEDPLGAFAVADIAYEFSRIVSYYEVSVYLSYSRSLQEIETILPVTGSSAIRQKLKLAMAGFSPNLLLRVSYFPGDEDDLRAMAAQAYYDTPSAAFGMPEIQVSVYPDSGSQRIIDISLQWPDSQVTLRQRSEELLQTAHQLLADHPASNGQYTPYELTELLHQTAAPLDSGGASDPYSALTGETANQLAHALALELLFQLSGADATLVTGFAEVGDTCWLIVDTGDGYRHLVFSAEGAALYTDLEMAGLGYLWNDGLYPDCVDYDADLSGPIPQTPEESETP